MMIFISKGKSVSEENNLLPKYYLTRNERLNLSDMGLVIFIAKRM